VLTVVVIVGHAILRQRDWFLQGCAARPQRRQRAANTRAAIDANQPECFGLQQNAEVATHIVAEWRRLKLSYQDAMLFVKN
jgi:hypothetical protein